MKNTYIFAIAILVVAAFCHSLITPLSAVVLQNGSATPFMVVAFTSCGALIWGIISTFIKAKPSTEKESLLRNRKIERRDIKYFILLGLFLLAGNILIYFGLTMCAASSASLVKCSTIALTAILALIFLRERISKRLWTSIILITLGAVALAVGDFDSIFTSPGLLLIAGACLCAAVCNCLLKKVVEIKPGKVIIISELICLVGGLSLGLAFGESFPEITTILFLLALGLIAYGLSMFLVLFAYRKFGATKSTVIKGIYPFLSAGLSLVIFQEQPTLAFIIALLLLIPGFYLVIIDNANQKAIDGTSLSSHGYEEQKSGDVRNYLTALGFVMLLGYMFLMFLEGVEGFVTGLEIGNFVLVTPLVLAVALIIIGVILIILRKRDLAGMLMIVFGFIVASTTVDIGYNRIILQAAMLVMFLFGGIMLFSKEKKKYFYSALLFLMGIYTTMLVLFNSTMLNLVLGVVTILYACLLCLFSTGLFNLSKLSNILTEDEELSFAVSGGMLCHLFLGVSVIPSLTIYINGTEQISIALAGQYVVICGIVIAIMALLLIFLARKPILSVIFLGTAVALILMNFTTGYSFYVPAVLLVAMGMFALLRKNSYLLLSITTIIYGISLFAGITVYGENVMPVAKFIFLLAVFLLSIYLSLAVFVNNKKLPVF